MIGHVDAKGRAMIVVRLRHPTTRAETELDVWVDTGFIGDLMLPAAEITRLGLPLSQGTTALLADGSEVDLDVYKARLHWFGKRRHVNVIATRDYSPLLGITLLREHELTIDYRAAIVSLE